MKGGIPILPLLLLLLTGCPRKPAPVAPGPSGDTPGPAQASIAPVPATTSGTVTPPPTTGPDDSVPGPVANGSGPAAPEATSDAFLVGIHPVESVVDADTVRLKDMKTAVRLLFIDAEEVYHSDKDRKASEEDFPAYARAKRGQSSRPVKYPTPVGEEAKAWTARFFEDVTEVRIESDDPGRMEGYYGRILGYVLVQKEGHWVNFSLELVRQGYSPYFCKYGYSNRFHEAFLSAEKEAREAKRGIWDPAKHHYPDYEERLAWWHPRAEMIRRFDAEYRARNEYICLADTDAAKRMAEWTGKEVTIFGVLQSIRAAKKPYLAFLAHRQSDDLMVACFKPEVWEKVPWDDLLGEPIFVRGTMKVYKNRWEIILDDAAQVSPGTRPPD